MDSTLASTKSYRREASNPKVGIVGAWFDPGRAWSGIPTGLAKGLSELDLYGGYFDMTPQGPGVRVVRSWMAITKRLGPTWPLYREMRAYTALSDVRRRLATPQGVDGWIQLPGYGRPVRGPVVAVTEITIDQLQSLDESFDLGFPDVSPEALRAWRRQQISSYKKALACCVASTWAKDSIVRDYSIRDTKVEVVGWGANLDVRPPISRDWSVPRFLFVGRQWERKNGEAVLRAFGRLRKECPTALLDVVGGHPALSQEGVQFHGPVAPDDPTARAHLVSLFQHATCFVMPSLVEPFGIVYVEAGRAGIPSIATRNGGASDAVGEGGVLVDPHDDSAILEAMRQLSDPRTARRLGALALSHSSLFTWPKVAERIVRAFGFAMDDRVERAEFPSR